MGSRSCYSIVNFQESASSSGDPWEVGPAPRSLTSRKAQHRLGIPRKPSIVWASPESAASCGNPQKAQCCLGIPRKRSAIWGFPESTALSAESANSYKARNIYIYTHIHNSNNIKDGDYFCYSEFNAIMQSSDRCNMVITTSLIYKAPGWDLVCSH